MNCPLHCSALFLVITLLWLAEKAPADWLQYRNDAGRSGATKEALPAGLSLRWKRIARHKPDPAWLGRDTRMSFDYAFHTVVAEGVLLFASSADGKVYALSAETGAEKWSFFTGAPVRFAPSVWKSNVYAASDDGFLYCLDLDKGNVKWKIRGGPAGTQILGNSRMISKWPVRGAPVLDSGVLYFAAGIWPSEGIYVYAVDADSGDVLWCNKKSGSIVMPQPHPTAYAESGISAQGDLVLSGDYLLVPTGRAVPAAFNRKDGTFRYFHLQKYSPTGGADVSAGKSWFLNGGKLFDSRTGLLLNKGFGARAVGAGTEKHVFFATPKQVIAFERDALWKTIDTFDRKGKKITKRVLGKPAWTIKNPIGASVSMIAASNAICLGGANRVCAVDTEKKETLFEAKVDGTAYGLSFAAGQLFVSTDKGTIYCFAQRADNKPAVVKPPHKEHFLPNKHVHDAAQQILEKTGITKGYCVDLECGNGALACALALQSNLSIYALADDPEHLQRMREKFDAAGLYGTRVTVHLQDEALEFYPDYFANLIVSGASLTGKHPGSATEDMIRNHEAQRLMRPHGGKWCLGAPGSIKDITRGPLEGEGTWTHQYCTPANTTCSDDAIVEGPLSILWFRDTDFVMPSRHGRGPAPLYLKGRLFVEGLDGLRCVDAYNGHTIWEYPLPGILKEYDQEHLMGAAGTGSNFCVTEKALYVHRDENCLKIDPASGRLLTTLKAPLQADGKKGTWGFIAFSDGVLFGSLADRSHIVKWRYLRGTMDTQFTESQLLFALDPDTGGTLWTYRPKSSIRNNTIAIGGELLFFIDRPQALQDRIAPPKKKAADEDRQAVLIALNKKNGSVAWKNGKEIFGTMLVLSTARDILLMTYQDTRFKLNSERGGRMAAFRASTGGKLWDIEADYHSRPLLNDRTIYAQPGAWDLVTGKKLPGFTFKRSYGCGTLAGSRKLLVYRSATLGYTDLTDDEGTINFGGIRPGCWINTIPAGGLVLMPDATSRCVCSYLISATVALQKAGREEK